MAAGIDPRRVRHAEAGEERLAGGDFQQAPTALLVFAPAPLLVGQAEAGHVFHLAIDDGHAIQVAAILGHQAADEGRAPLRDEVVLAVEGAETGEAGVHGPDFAFHKADLMNADIAGVMAKPGEEGGVVFFLRLELGGHGGLVIEIPELMPGADGQPAGAGLVGDSHRAKEVAKMSVQSIPVRADDDELARLVGRNEQRNPQLTKKSGEIRGVAAGKGRLLRGLGSGGRAAESGRGSIDFREEMRGLPSVQSQKREQRGRAHFFQKD